MARREVGVAICPQHHERGAGHPAHDVAQKGKGRAIGPVQVIEHEQHRTRARHLEEESGDRLEQAVPLEVRVDAARSSQGATRVSTRKQAGELRHRWLEIGRSLRAGRAGEAADRFDERLVGHEGLLVASTEEHARSRGVDVRRQSRGQRGLADSGLAGDEHDLRSTGRHRRPRVA